MCLRKTISIAEKRTQVVAQLLDNLNVTVQKVRATHSSSELFHNDDPHELM
jgi:hypothetical protein